jgi:chorismate synthase
MGRKYTSPGGTVKEKFPHVLLKTPIFPKLHWSMRSQSQLTRQPGRGAGRRIRYNSISMLRYYTAGESHGEAIVAFLSGMPAGLKVDRAFMDRELWRRQQGYGRGGRMKMERDKAHILSGVRHGRTIGSPIAVKLDNEDWKNWTEALPVESGDPAKHKRVASPRPGHADLAGALKYNFAEARYVLERASARESAARVAMGAVAKLFLRELNVSVLSHVVAVGGAAIDGKVAWPAIEELFRREEVSLNCADPSADARMKEEVDHALKTGDSVGGVFEVVARGVPPGLGTYTQWDERLDALLAGAVMSLQAVKAVEIGEGIRAASSAGSAVHDEIGYEKSAGMSGFTRARNNAGGIEGGVSNGEEIRVRGYLKPISTLRRPLQSVDFATREPVKAAYERSDVCVVPAAGVAAEAMVALTLARCALEKFGGDSMVEVERNYRGYVEQLKSY